jgi:hypothetical protein
MSQSAEEKKKAMFMSVDAFKALKQVSKFEVLLNPKTEKLFVALENGATYRCQGDLDSTKPVQFMTSEDDVNWENACFINYDDTKGAKTVATF